MSENVAIYGVTGALGREVQIALEVEHDGLGELIAVAGPRSAGQSVRWRGNEVEIIGPSEVELHNVDIAVFATSPEVAKAEAPKLLHAGAKVIDGSGSLPGAPLVWPRLASMKAVDFEVVSAVALPSGLASTLAPLVEALAAIEALGVARVVTVDVVQLTAASAAGKSGIDALSKQAVGLLGFQPVIDPAPFSHLLAFNTLTSPASVDEVDETRLARELVLLVPQLPLAPSLVTLWTPAFSGLTLVITLRAATRFDEAALGALTQAIEAHPDLAFADAQSPVESEDDEDGDGAGAVIAAVAPDAFALRDALDQDEVRLAPVSLTRDGALRVVAFADPLHRTALAAQELVARWVQAAEADA